MGSARQILDRHKRGRRVKNPASCVLFMWFAADCLGYFLWGSLVKETLINECYFIGAIWRWISIFWNKNESKNFSKYVLFKVFILAFILLTVSKYQILSKELELSHSKRFLNSKICINMQSLTFNCFIFLKSYFTNIPSVKILLLI